MRISKIMVHRGEEPVISGTSGSGAIFFGGCALRCVFCQNADISVGGKGKDFSAAELEKTILSLEEKGVHNINLVTAGHYLNYLLPVLKRVKPRLSVPVVYNTSAYESVDAIRELEGLVDVYLPDYKYFSSELAKKYSAAPDYPTVATAAITEMLRQQPSCEFDGNGLIRRGVIIRHLVLPSCRRDSIEVLRDIKQRFFGAFVSIMRQYTPSFNRSDYPELNRRVTAFEYDSVVKEAETLALRGFAQQKGCETDELTPDFSVIFED